MNSLLFQTTAGTGVSIIDAKGSRKYVAVYDNYEEVEKPKVLSQHELEKIRIEYIIDKPFISDYENVDVFQKLFEHCKHFSLAENVDDVKPLCVKGAI